MVSFGCTLAIKKNIISYGIAPIFFNFVVRNVLRIWYNFGMFILFFIIIGLTFTKFLISTVSNLSYCLCLYNLFYKKNGRLFLLSSFEASASVGHSFLSFLMVLFVESLCELCWLLLLLPERISFFFLFLC